MKKILLYILFIGFALSSFSQNYLNISNIIYGQSLYNPAYSASYNSINGLLLYRTQYLGLKGGPQTIAFNLQYPIKNKNFVVGFTAFNQSIGMKNQTNVNTNINYKITISENQHLSIGLKAGIVNYNFNKSDAVFSDDIDDPFFNEPTESYILPDIGFGLFYFSNKFFVGFSLPQLFSTKFDLNEFKYQNSGFKFTEQHAFIYTGYIYQINESLHLKPSVLIKYSPNTPIQADINVQLIYKNKFGGGIGYRTSESIVFMIKYNIGSNLFLGYSYDYILNELSSYSSGTHEIVLSFKLNSQISDSKFGSIRSF